MNIGYQELASARIHTCQGLLLPLAPREICKSLGLNWWAAVKLHADGWLSFNPEAFHTLNERQEAELRFVGALVAAGCDEGMLHRLLQDLEKPLCYRPDRIYYDWAARKWRLLPEPPEQPEDQFSGWLGTLEEKGDLASLESIMEDAASVIERLTKN